MEQITPFKQLGLNPEMLSIIEKKGFVNATEIQTKAIPLILGNQHDIVGIAQTGTGKTAAFGLPMIQMISRDKHYVKAIILTPTRELAVQVAKELTSFSIGQKLHTLAVYGGAPIFTQIRELQRGVDIVVGTPGRVQDMIRRGNLKLGQLEFFILDEADEMLKMGFIDDIETIFKEAPEHKRVLLFSATMPPRIQTLAKKYMHHQVVVEVQKKIDSKQNITQIYYRVRRSEKIDVIKNIVAMADDFHGLIFCQTKVMVDELTEKLKHEKLSVDCIHGDIKQSGRERILRDFRNKKISILVATDVAARGIDVENLTHVINYTLPEEIDLYIHRIGRTGRAGKAGMAISLIDPREEYKIHQIAHFTKNVIKLEPLPTFTEVQGRKQEKIMTDLEKIITSKKNAEYIPLAKNILKTFGDIDTVSALLLQIKGAMQAAPVPREEASRVSQPEFERRTFGGHRDVVGRNNSHREKSRGSKGFSSFGRSGSRDRRDEGGHGGHPHRKGKFSKRRR